MINIAHTLGQKGETVTAAFSEKASPSLSAETLYVFLPLYFAILLPA
jgi:hypothetical protein